MRDIYTPGTSPDQKTIPLKGDSTPLSIPREITATSPERITVKNSVYVLYGIEEDIRGYVPELAVPLIDYLKDHGGEEGVYIRDWSREALPEEKYPQFKSNTHRKTLVLNLCISLNSVHLPKIGGKNRIVKIDAPNPEDRKQKYKYKWGIPTEVPSEKNDETTPVIVFDHPDDEFVIEPLPFEEPSTPEEALQRELAQVKDIFFPNTRSMVARRQPGRVSAKMLAEREDGWGKSDSEGRSRIIPRGLQIALTNIPPNLPELAQIDIGKMQEALTEIPRDVEYIDFRKAGFSFEIVTRLLFIEAAASGSFRRYNRDLDGATNLDLRRALGRIIRIMEKNPDAQPTTTQIYQKAETFVRNSLWQIFEAHLRGKYFPPVDEKK